MGRLTSRFYDRFMRGAEEACLRRWRGELLAPVSGRVLEVGSGTGVNIPLYPDTVDNLVMSEPDPHMRARMEEKIDRGTHLPVTVSDGGLEHLPFPDGSFDFVACMLVLCSVPDLGEAVTEIRRVLVPGGRLVFLEHVAAEGRPRRLRWQRRLEPIWKVLSGNCHLTRETHRAIVNAGFTVENVKRESMRKAFPVVRPTIRGVAVRPA